MDLQHLGWLCLVALFIASLLIVLGWLLLYSLTMLRMRRSRSTSKLVGLDQIRPQLSITLPQQSLSETVWGFLLKRRSGWDRGPPSEAGVKGLLTCLLSFKSIREQWQRTWVKALNEQACRHGVSYSFWKGGSVPE